MKDLLEKQFICITNDIKSLPSDIDDEILLSLHGRREEVIILYSLLLDLHYSDANNILINFYNQTERQVNAIDTRLRFKTKNNY